MHWEFRKYSDLINNFRVCSIIQNHSWHFKKYGQYYPISVTTANPPPNRITCPSGACKSSIYSLVRLAFCRTFSLVARASGDTKTNVIQGASDSICNFAWVVDHRTRILWLTQSIFAKGVDEHCGLLAKFSNKDTWAICAVDIRHRLRPTWVYVKI